MSSTSPLHNSGKTLRCSTTPRCGMTLVELLIAITIIAILSAILLGAASSAMEVARKSRTKQLIVRLHTLLMERADSYRNRRVDAEFDGEGQVLAAQRLHVLRTTMQMEMPDRWSDILNAEPGIATPTLVANNSFDPDSTNYRFGLYPAASSTSNDQTLIPRTALNRLYLRKYAQLDKPGLDMNALLLNQSAECLYLTIMFGTAEGEARGLFKENDIGDTDGDGALEFLDGWGNPIRFIRWPHGYADFSLLLDKDDPISNHDPLDIFRVDTEESRNLSVSESPYTDDDHKDPSVGSRLIPLIYSAGSDEEYGIVTTNSTKNFQFEPTKLTFSGNNQTQLVLDPYQQVVPEIMTVKIWVGQPVDSDQYGQPGTALTSEHHIDNLNNHLITCC